MKKKDIRNIIIFMIVSFAIISALIWLIIEFVPYLIAIIALPAWLCAALADGANVK